MFTIRKSGDLLKWMFPPGPIQAGGRSHRKTAVAAFCGLPQFLFEVRDMEQDLNITITGLDEAATEKARQHQAMLAKPPGSLGVLEALSIQLAGITGKVHNTLRRKHLLVFAADNGVVAEGVSSAPQSVTLQQTVNLTRYKTGASVLAKHVGCGLTVCDVGVNGNIAEPAVLDRKIAYGTGNIAQGPAMSRGQALTAIKTGRELAKITPADVLGIGEMGIGNTTTSSAVLCALTGTEVEAVTGRGGGITGESFRKKKAVIRRAIQIDQPDKGDVVDVLSKVGGLDLAAMCGAFLGAAERRLRDPRRYHHGDLGGLRPAQAGSL